MPYFSNCPACKARFQILPKQIGHKVKCHKCGKVFQLAELPNVPTPANTSGPKPNDWATKKQGPPLVLLFVLVLAGVVVVGGYFIANSWIRDAQGPKAWQEAPTNDITDAFGVSQLTMMLALAGPHDKELADLMTIANQAVLDFGDSGKLDRSRVDPFIRYCQENLKTKYPKVWKEARTTPNTSIWFE